MRFWDASAIVPLLVIEVTTESAQSVAAQHPAMSVWWATEVECASAIARLERDGTIDDTGMAQAFERLNSSPVDGRSSTRQSRSKKLQYDCCASIRSARPTRCNSPQRLWLRMAAPRPSSS